MFKIRRGIWNLCKTLGLQLEEYKWGRRLYGGIWYQYRSVHTGRFYRGIEFWSNLNYLQTPLGRTVILIRTENYD